MECVKYLLGIKMNEECKINIIKYEETLNFGGNSEHHLHLIIKLEFFYLSNQLI